MKMKNINENDCFREDMEVVDIMEAVKERGATGGRDTHLRAISRDTCLNNRTVVMEIITSMGKLL